MKDVTVTLKYYLNAAHAYLPDRLRRLINGDSKKGA